MKAIAFGAVCAVLTSPLSAGSQPVRHHETWREVTWNSERAFACDAGPWRAVVSVERDRLVYFGTADGAHNLLYVPKTRDDPAGWGGHRLWLGPQTNWSPGWPPPAAWEKSAAEKVEHDGATLRLVMPDAGHRWPRVAREYFWHDERLHCRARITGGTRSAQVIQILQVPPDMSVEVQAVPSRGVPRGYVQLHMGRHPSPQPLFAPPPHVTADGHSLRLKFLDRTEKFGFTPQPLFGRLGSFTLQLDRGEGSGPVVSTPDDGFVTQVYLGSGESQLIELEQLSPLLAAGSEASFEIVVTATELPR